MIGTNGALILMLFNFIAGGVVGLLASALVLRNRITFLRGVSSLFVSGFAFLISIACLNCSYFQNGACVDPTHAVSRNQLADHAMLTAAVIAGVTGLLLALALLAINRLHRHHEGTNNV